MSFKDYVTQRPITDTPQGDFTMDARSARDFPDPNTWDELRSYLRLRGACPGAIKAAYLVWAGYQKMAKAQMDRQ